MLSVGSSPNSEQSKEKRVGSQSDCLSRVKEAAAQLAWCLYAEQQPPPNLVSIWLERGELNILKTLKLEQIGEVLGLVEQDLNNISTPEQQQLFLKELASEFYQTIRYQQGLQVRGKIIEQFRLLASPQADVRLAVQIESRLEHLQRNFLYFDEYHQLALPYFYGQVANIGPTADSDFTTPALSLGLPTALAQHINRAWHEQDQPREFIVLELAAGTGMLAATTCEVIRLDYPKLYQALNYIALEPSERFHEQANALYNYVGKVNQVRGSVEQLPKIFPNGIEGLVFSVELFDSVPFRMVRLNSETGLLEELTVCPLAAVEKSSEYDLSWSVTEVGSERDQSARHYLEMWQSYRKSMFGDVQGVSAAAMQPEGVPIFTELKHWFELAAKVLVKGELLTIDYCAGTKAGEPLRQLARAQSKFLPRTGVEAAIRFPGQVDITADVPSSLLVAWSGDVGFDYCSGPCSFEQFLSYGYPSNMSCDLEPNSFFVMRHLR